MGQPLLSSEMPETRFDLPDTTGDTWVKLKPLTYGALQRARQAKLDQHFAMFSKVGPDALAAFQNQGSDDNEGGDPLETYDIHVLLTESIVGWSSEAEVTPANIAQLSGRYAEAIAREVIRLNVLDSTEGEG